MAKDNDLIEQKVIAMTGAAEALKLLKGEPYVDNEKIMKQIVKFAGRQKDPQSKMLIVGTASKAISLVERNKNISEREVMKIVMNELPMIMENLREEENIN